MINCEIKLSFFGNIKNLFAGGVLYSPAASSFTQIDTNKVKSRFRLKEFGEERGGNDLPETNAKGFDDVEQKIITFIESEANLAKETYYDNIKTYENRISSLSSEGHVGVMEQIALTAEGDFKAITLRDETGLYNAREAVISRKKELEDFKSKNNLMRPARYPKSRFLFYSIAMLLIVFETSINGMFFAQGHELGLLGGGFTAFIPSFLNVILGYFLGNIGLRLLNHIKSIKKAFGLLVLIISLSLVFIINLAIAHYRTAMLMTDVSGSEQAAETALQSFLSSPFELQNIESWLLFLMGWVFFLIATFDFWKMDDPYLNYGDVAREHDKKLSDYADLKDESLQELQDIRSSSVEDLDNASNLVNAKLNEANAIIDAEKRWKHLFKDHIDHLQNVGAELISYYRNCNRQNRKTKAPKRFDKPWILNTEKIKASDLSADKIIKQFEKEAVDNKKAYSKYTNKITSSYSKALDKYKTIEQL